MDKVSRDSEHAARDVTIVISRKIKPVCEKQYDDWLRRYLILEKKIIGYEGICIVPQLFHSQQETLLILGYQLHTSANYLLIYSDREIRI